MGRAVVKFCVRKAYSLIENLQILGGGTMRQTSTEGKIPVYFLIKTILFSYLLTGVFLLLLAFLLYRFGLGEKTVAISVIAIYVGASLCAGFLTGKKMKSGRFLWGLLAGSTYFCILLLLSLWLGEPGSLAGSRVFTGFLLCAGGGMLGGMLS